VSGQWADSNRRAELPPDWYTSIRPYVLARDEHRCRARTNGRACGRWANQVDHIGDRDDHRPENLQALCADCHNRKSSQQGNAARWRERVQRPPERHPGLISP
jgi:5-methylcytosine-specific restriction endonuclease McrA